MKEKEIHEINLSINILDIKLVEFSALKDLPPNYANTELDRDKVQFEFNVGINLEVANGTMHIDLNTIFFAEKEKKTGAISVVFLGDGAMGEGIVYESLNMASLWNLPILFVLEHNQYAQTTPTTLAHAGDITLRPKAFNIETKTLKADNVLSIYKTVQEIVNKVRNQQKPFFLSLQTYRYAPHSKGDDFRSKKEIENQKKTDPLQHLRWALDQIHSDRLISIEENIETRILRAVDSAKLAESYPPHAFFKEKRV